LSVIVGVIAIVVVIIFYFAAKTKKSLAYEVLSENPLISIDNEIKGKLQILLDGQPIENVHLLLIRITNDGKVPITANDYERPVALKFKESSNILSAELASAVPENLVIKPTIHDKLVALDPVLLNSGDVFTVKVLVGEYSGPVEVDARIAGVKNIRVARKQAFTKWDVFSIAIVAAPVLISLVFLLRIWNPPPVIETLHIDPKELTANSEATLQAAVSGGDSSLTFNWSVDAGTIIFNGPFAIFTPPNVDGPVRVKVQLKVVDRWGREATESILVPVTPQSHEDFLEPSPTPQSKKPTPKRQPAKI
jgi:hypothetical protein